MAVGLVFDGVGVTRAQYAQVLHQVWPDDSVPPGMLRHVAGTVEGVMSAWRYESPRKR